MRAVLAAVALGSAVVGSALGAGATIWLLKGDSAEERVRSSAPSGEGRDRPLPPPDLDTRIAALEASLRALERRRLLLPVPAASPGAPGDAASGSAPPSEPSLVDDPVFEAAVRDVIDRAEVDRDQERELRRDDRRRQFAQRWAEDLVPALKLNDAQKAKLGEIAESFMNELSKLWERDGGLPMPRAERRQKAEQLRAEAEAKLSGVLDPSQMSTYEKLDDDQRLGFPARRRGRD